MGSWARKIQLGRETTAGTPVAATTIWRGEGTFIKDDSGIELVAQRIGLAIPVLDALRPMLGASMSLAATPMSFEQGPHVMEAGIMTATATQDGSGSGYIYAYTFPTTSAPTIKTYTIETGDDQQAREMEYSFVTQFTMAGQAGQAVTIAADWQGRQATNTSFTAGQSAPSVDYVYTSDGSFYLDDAGGTIGTTQVSTTLLSWQLQVTTGWTVKHTADSGERYFSYAYYDVNSFDAQFTATYEHNATAVAEYADMESLAPRLARIRISGPALTTSGTTYTYKTLNLDLPMLYTEFSAIEDSDGNSVVNVTGAVGYESAGADAPSITFVNELSALP